jgi:hypothetical protein
MTIHISFYPAIRIDKPLTLTSEQFFHLRDLYDAEWRLRGFERSP